MEWLIDHNFGAVIIFGQLLIVTLVIMKIETIFRNILKKVFRK